MSTDAPALPQIDKSSAFLLPAESYTQHLDPIADYIHQSALYISKMKGIPVEQATTRLRELLRNKTISFNNPKVVHFLRKENGDREQESISLTGYLRETTQNNNIIVPTLTTYLHPSERRSLIVKYLDVNVSERSASKKLAYKYEAEKNDVQFSFYWKKQDNAKRENNAVSGGFATGASVISNKSAHSTLTSITRTISSLSNASNERVLEGNRHYYTPQIALNNMISIISVLDKTQLIDTMVKYQLHYPTVAETLACIRHSMDLYCAGRKAIEELETFISTLSPEERAAIVYTGDLYHLRVHNEAMVRQLITALADTTINVEYEHPINVIKLFDEQVVICAHQCCISTLAGKGKDYTLLAFADQNRIANTAMNIYTALQSYRDFFKTFFLTKNSPPTIATLPDQIRRSVVLSDTDSTMFSTDSWVLWYFGRYTFSDRGYAINGAVTFIATQSIAHLLALFSANMNVERSRLFTLAMKPEYLFTVFAQTSVSKHYYAAQKMKEGAVYEDIKMEIKGVHMKNSTVPKDLIQDSAKLMESIVRTLMREEPIRLIDTLHHVADKERMITESIHKGEVTYLKRDRINEAKAYKNGPEESPYRYFTFWANTFGKHYPAAIAPPYVSVQLPVNLHSRKRMTAWIESIENTELSEQLKHWFLVTNQGRPLRTLRIPIDVCTAYGIPKEILSVINREKIILSLCKSHRNVLESLGYYPKKDWLIANEGY